MGFLGPVVQIPCQTQMLPAHSQALGPHTQATPQPQHNLRTHPRVLRFGSEISPKGHVAKNPLLPTCVVWGTGMVCRRCVWWGGLVGESASLEIMSLNMFPDPSSASLTFPALPCFLAATGEQLCSCLPPRRLTPRAQKQCSQMTRV